MKKYYHVKVECPRCNKVEKLISTNAIVRVSCGDCLMNDVEIVNMTITPICEGVQDDRS